MSRGMPMRALSIVAVTALASVAATLGSPSQTLRAARFRVLAQSAANAAAAPTELRVGQTYGRELSGGVSHRYQLRLDAGEYAGLIVEQRGIDVAIRLLGPDGGALADFQDELRIGHTEPLEIVAEKAATYTLLVKPGGATASPGSYAIRTVEIRTARDEDGAIQEARALRVRYAQLLEEAKYDEAKPLIERALTISERVRGAGDPFVWGLLRDLGSVASDLEDFSTAELLFHRALAAAETTLGPQHPAVALAATELAWVYQHTGRRPKAEELANQALEVIERTLGPDHPQVARCLIKLGTIRYAAGDREKAEAIDRRAVAILENTASPETTTFAAALHNLGLVLGDKRDFEHAALLERRSLAIVEKLQGTRSYGVAKSWQWLGMIARQQKDYAGAEAYYQRSLAILQEIRGADHPEVAADLNNLANIYRIRGDVDRSIETHLRALRIWEKTSGRYHGNTLLSLGNIARAYAGTGDIDRAIDFQRRADAVIEAQFALNVATGSEKQRLTFVRSIAEAYGEPHYAAYVLSGRAPPRGRDLGPAATIDAAVEVFRQALRNPARNDVDARGRAVDSFLLAPLRGMVGDASRLLIAADGELSLIPFEALVDDHDRYAIERYAISYLSSGRDLLRFQVPREARSEPLIIANPLFGEPEPGGAPRGLTAASSARRSVTTAPDLTTVYFAPLAGTADEADAIKSLFPDTLVLSREQASKAAITRVEAPRFLHIATHGFFLQDPSFSHARTAGATRGIDAATRIDNPLLRSGLALSGANLNTDSNDTGISDGARSVEPESLGHQARDALRLRHRRRRGANRRGRVRVAAGVLPGRRRDARDEPLARERRRHAGDDDRLLQRAEGWPRPRERVAAGAARDARAQEPSAPVLLGELHSSG
jgi:tetratricopeptide (TPR) repeat protein